MACTTQEQPIEEQNNTEDSIDGENSDESSNNNLKEISERLEEIMKDEKYYTDAKKYWSNVPNTVDGMLGGFGNISFTDIKGSSLFLQQLFKSKPSPGQINGLDCGAGIGRVSKNLLLQFFDKVDLVEQDQTFCETARKTLEPSGKLGEIFNVGLQNFNPEAQKYDVIWSQWVLGHLTDEHIVEFFFKCSRALTKNGVFVIKENFTFGTTIDLDETDSSVTRPVSVMKQLLTKGNFRVIKELKQNNFPKGLYPVHMLAMRPIC